MNEDQETEDLKELIKEFGKASDGDLAASLSNFGVELATRRSPRTTEAATESGWLAERTL